MTGGRCILRGIREGQDTGVSSKPSCRKMGAPKMAISWRIWWLTSGLLEKPKNNDAYCQGKQWKNIETNNKHWFLPDCWTRPQNEGCKPDKSWISWAHHQIIHWWDPVPGLQLGLCFEACRIKACCTVKCRRLKPMSRFGLIIPCGVRLGNGNPSWTCRAFCLEFFDLLQHVTRRWRCELATNSSQMHPPLVCRNLGLKSRIPGYP